MAKVLIVGCGDLGTRLGLGLVQAGHQVYAMRRNISQLPEPFQGLAQDVLTAWSPLPAAFDLVFYTLAAQDRSESAYRAAYQLGVVQLLETLIEQGQTPRRLFFTSSTSVYHQQQGEWVDERSPVCPTSFTGQAMLAGERLLGQSPFPATCVRLSGLYGPGRYWLIRQALSGCYCPPDPLRYTNRVHREDATRALAHLAELALADKPLADCYLVSDPNPVPLHDVLGWIRQQLHAPDPGPEAPWLPERGSKRCDSRRIRDSGFEFHYPDYRSGYRAILQTYRG